MDGLLVVVYDSREKQNTQTIRRLSVRLARTVRELLAGRLPSGIGCRMEFEAVSLNRIRFLRTQEDLRSSASHTVKFNDQFKNIRK